MIVFYSALNSKKMCIAMRKHKFRTSCVWCLFSVVLLLFTSWVCNCVNRFCNWFSWLVFWSCGWKGKAEADVERRETFAVFDESYSWGWFWWAWSVLYPCDEACLMKQSPLSCFSICMHLFPTFRVNYFFLIISPSMSLFSFFLSDLKVKVIYGQNTVYYITFMVWNYLQSSNV